MVPLTTEQLTPHIFPREHFAQLFERLREKGYRVIGPTVQQHAVQWEEISSPEELPVGWRDHQGPGHYQLEADDRQRYFNVVHGPQSLKPLTFAPRETLLTLDRSSKTFSAIETIPDLPPTAVFGVRGCDLAGLGIQDTIFLKGPYPDPYYQQRRESLFLIAVNCTRALETCFCASMGTGPRAEGTYDLRLTEGVDDFVIEAGTLEGWNVLESLSCPIAPEARLSQDEAKITSCAESQTRSLPQESLPETLQERHDHPRWDEVAKRCLSCANCTMVCPTCFCHGVEETPSLDYQHSTHARVWDSCFTPDHGYIHGKNFRPTTKDRYRMWLTHKLGTWVEQFGTSGCVGCGRCITWCPVGIDLTEEINAFKEGHRVRQKPEGGFILSLDIPLLPLLISD